MLVTREGYLRQEIDAESQQAGRSGPWDPAEWATPLGAMVAVPIEDRQVRIRPWLCVLTCPVGHSAPVLLLDTRLEENASEDRGTSPTVSTAATIYCGSGRRSCWASVEKCCCRRPHRARLPYGVDQWRPGTP